MLREYEYQSNEQGAYTPDYMNNSYGKGTNFAGVLSFANGYINQFQPAEGLRPTLPQRPIAKPKRRNNMSKSSNSSEVTQSKPVQMAPRKQPDILPVNENDMPGLKRVKEFLGQREGKRAKESAASDDEGIQLDTNWLINSNYSLTPASKLREEDFSGVGYLDNLLELPFNQNGQPAINFTYGVPEYSPSLNSQGSPDGGYLTDSSIDLSPYTEQIVMDALDNLDVEGLDFSF